MVYSKRAVLSWERGKKKTLTFGTLQEGGGRGPTQKKKSSVTELNRRE